MRKDYRVGDTIEYRHFGGGLRVVTVTHKERDIKNGFPGFDGDTPDGDTWWGYDHQIVRVVKRGT